MMVEAILRVESPLSVLRIVRAARGSNEELQLDRTALDAGPPRT
jgi:hypothetical protein